MSRPHIQVSFRQSLWRNPDPEALQEQSAGSVLVSDFLCTAFCGLGVFAVSLFVARIHRRDAANAENRAIQDIGDSIKLLTETETRKPKLGSGLRFVRFSIVTLLVIQPVKSEIARIAGLTLILEFPVRSADSLLIQQNS